MSIVAGDAGTPSDVRLSSNSSRCVGRLELLLNGSWSSVCGRSWTRSQAEVVCGQLHCGPAQALLYRPQALSELDPSVKIWSGQFICQGGESSLQDCPPSDNGVYNCTHEEDVFLACGESVPGTVSPATFRPTTVPEPTDAPRFRLVDGAHTCSGAVELYLKGWWGPVSLVGFPRATAEMICRSLGCGTILQNLTRSRQTPMSACPRVPVIWNLKDCRTTDGISDIEACAIRDLPRRCSETAQLTCSGFQPKVKARLVDGMSRCDGTVEVLHLGRWRSLCFPRGPAQSWGAEVCRDLHCGNVSMISQLDETHSGGRRGKAGVSCSAEKFEECHLFQEEPEPACTLSRITCQQDLMPRASGLGAGDVASILLGLVLLVGIVTVCGPVAYKNLKKVRRRKARQWIGPTAASQNVSFYRDHVTIRPRSEDLQSGHHDYSETPKKMSYLSAYPALEGSLRRSSDPPDNSSGSEYDFSGARRL
ncbi:hypothetical protein NDU88_000497 [Pleurodeles waltl]|uniref:SRCR domain-containing protein n=1 Tax=Pleurodeles waltl TaxID=8319 RepID=A0AAV7SWK7_PLEWA|nr:hypothetical protein NDU88_000497 [Pleurodeles waltl]